jgi:UDP-N-acetyl-D-mannosaminuronic acid dehydrogenase
VIWVEVSTHVVDTINAGKIHIIEPELDGIVHKAVTEGMLSATLTPEPADAFIIAVPTPFKEDHVPDLSYIQAAARMIAPVLEKGNLVILESTSPVGATLQMAEWLAEARPDLSFPQTAGDDAEVQVAHCPERVLPGHVVRELVENDRIIGGMSSKATEMATAMYRLVVQGDCIATDAKTAEMCKLVENSSRDVQIAFANELSIICDKFGIDVWELIRLANRHPRVNILQPGAGVGGHCIAVDPWFIVASAPDEARLIRAARVGNDSKPDWVLEKGKQAVIQILAQNPDRAMADIKVACLGLAFKPDIDDLRESPALEITRRFAELGCQILAVEPNIENLPAKLDAKNIRLENLQNAIQNADLVCVLVKHTAFKNIKQNIPNTTKLLDVVGL